MTAAAEENSFELTRTIGHLPAGLKGVIESTADDAGGAPAGPDRERNIDSAFQAFPLRFIPAPERGDSPRARAVSMAREEGPNGRGVLVSGHEVKRIK